MMKTNKGLLILFIFFFLSLAFTSCSTNNKNDCNIAVSDSIVFKVVTDLIIGDTLLISDSLVNLKLKNKENGYIYLSYINPKFEKVLRIIAPDSPEVDISYFSLVKPNFTKQDSINLICQVKSDTIDKFLSFDLIKVKDLRIMDMKIYNFHSLDSLYGKYRQFYSLTKPFFYLNNSRCIIDVRFHCGPVCGSYWIYLMERSNDRWIIKKKAYYGGS